MVPPGKATCPEWLRSFSARLVKSTVASSSVIDDRDQHGGIAQRFELVQPGMAGIEAMVAIVVAGMGFGLRRNPRAKIRCGKRRRRHLVHHALSRFSFSAGMIG